MGGASELPNVGCLTLRGIADASLLGGQAVADADGVAVDVASLRALSGDKEVQRYGCLALSGIAKASLIVVTVVFV